MSELRLFLKAQLGLPLRQPSLHAQVLTETSRVGSPLWPPCFPTGNHTPQPPTRPRTQQKSPVPDGGAEN